MLINALICLSCSSRGSPTGRGFPFSPNNNQGNEVSTVYEARPGSAPAKVIQRFRPNPNFPATFNVSPTSRASSSLRQSSGRNAEGVPSPSGDSPMMSYSLWAPRDQLTNETITGSLALEVEMLKEKLQRQTDIAVRAEAALNQLAINTKGSQAALRSQLDELRSRFSSSQKTQTETQEEV